MRNGPAGSPPPTSNLAIDTRRGAYGALFALTLLWGSNWIVMKFALMHAHPLAFNIHRTWLAIVAVFAFVVLRRNLAWPKTWWPVVVTGFFGVVVNFGSTTMALADGGAGRTSVLTFTMPFWTLLIARVVLHERVRGVLWLAIGFAFTGLVLIVEPWRWEGSLAPKLWAVLSGLGWAAATVATKYYQARDRLDMLNFLAWHLLIGVVPLTALSWLLDLPATQWSATYAGLLLWTAVVATAFGFMIWVAVLRRLAAGTAALALFAIPVVALILSMAIFGERLSGSEWLGIASIAVGLAIIAFQAAGAERRSKPAASAPREDG